MKIAKFVLSILIIIFSIEYLKLRPGAFSKSLFDTCQIFVIVATILFFISSQKNGGKGHWLKPSYLFVIGFLAVNLQYLLDIRLGIKFLSSVRIIRETVLNHCTVLALLGIMSFALGYMWKPLKNAEANIVNGKFNGLYSNNNRIPNLVVFIQLALFVVFILTVDIASFLSGEDYGTDSTTNAESLLYVFNSIVVLLVSRDSQPNISFPSYLRRFPIISLVVFAIYILLRLVSGDRGPFVYSVLLLIFGYLYVSRKKYRFALIAGFLLLGTLIISLIGIARNLDTAISLGGRMSDAYSQFATDGRFSNGEGSLIKLTEELGYSFYVNQVDVYSVEVGGEDYHFFSYPIYGLLSGIPFMPGIIQHGLGVSPKDFSSGGYANYQFFGGDERTWGVGTTVVGDFYLSFGFIGVIIGLFFTGILFRYLDSILFIEKKRKTSLVVLYFVLLYSSKAIYMPRATIFMEFPRFVWGVILLWVLSNFADIKLNKRARV